MKNHTKIKRLAARSSRSASPVAAAPAVHDEVHGTHATNLAPGAHGVYIAGDFPSGVRVINTRADNIGPGGAAVAVFTGRAALLDIALRHSRAHDAELTPEKREEFREAIQDLHNGSEKRKASAVEFLQDLAKDVASAALKEFISDMLRKVGIPV